MKDIARESGVSACLASKILNGKEEGVWASDTTRERILASARRLNYTPNHTARQLAKGRKDAIGIFFDKSSDFESGFIMKAVKGIVSRAEDLGYTVNLGLAKCAKEVKLLETGAIDSAILIPAGEGQNDSLCKAMQSQGMPHVFLNPAEAMECNAVCCDDVGGMKQAVSHLASLGHMRIAYVGQDTDHPSEPTRRNAYAESLSALGGTPVLLNPGHVISKNLIAQAVKKKKTTAFIIYQDAMLVDFYMACRSLGLDLPRDLSVIAVNDIIDHRRFIPAPTAIRIPIFEMGMAAVDLLDTHIKNGAPVPSVTFDETLIVRDSCRKINKQ